MLLARIYTAEDFRKFCEIIEPFLDEKISSEDGLIQERYLGTSYDELLDLLKEAFPQEAGMLPSVFLNFVRVMMNELGCEPYIFRRPITGMVAYDITPYIRMKNRYPYDKTIV